MELTKIQQEVLDEVEAGSPNYTGYPITYASQQTEKLAAAKELAEFGLIVHSTDDLSKDRPAGWYPIIAEIQ